MRKRDFKGRFISKYGIANYALLIGAILLFGIPVTKAVVESRIIRLSGGQEAVVVCETSEWRIQDQEHIVSVTPTPPKPTATPKPTPKPKTNNSNKEIGAMWTVVSNYGGKYSYNDVKYIHKQCGYHHGRVLIAISVIESSMGKNSNFGYNYWNYNRFAWKPKSKEAAITHMCGKLKKQYPSMVKNGKVTPWIAKCYERGCNGKGYNQRWQNVVQDYYNKMTL